MTVNNGTPVPLPFAEADLVGPEDRSRPEMEIVMYNWRAATNASTRDWMLEMGGGIVRAVQCAPKKEAGVIYAQVCDPDAPKAHAVSLSPDHRSFTFSLFTPLQSLDFPKVGEGHKAVFKCRPETYGSVKLLVIQVAGYRVEKVDQRTLDDVAAAQQPLPAGQGGLELGTSPE